MYKCSSSLPGPSVSQTRVDDKKSDRKIYHAGNLKLAEAIRRKLLAYRPRPCVYVYPLAPKGDGTLGYDVHISNEWGSFPSDKYFVDVKTYLNVEAPLIEAQVDAEVEI